MRGTSRPTMASAVRASWPKICGAQNVSNPSPSACRASATMSSTLPSFTVMLKLPVRMEAHSTGHPHRGREGSGQRDEVEPARAEVVELAVGHQQHLGGRQL